MPPLPPPSAAFRGAGETPTDATGGGYSEFGPRTRRVRVKDFKVYQDAHRKTPRARPRRAVDVP